MGSSKKQTVGYKYYLGMHMILAHGPVDALYQLKVDDREAWKGTSTGSQITIDAEGLFGGESREGGVSGLVDVEMGGVAQVANDYLSGQLADVPGHRGVVGLVLRKCYLGMNPYLKRWAALLQRIYVTQDGDEQWYPAKAGIPSGNTVGDADAPYLLEQTSSGWQYQQIAHHADPGTTNLTVPASGWAAGGQMPFGGDDGVDPGIVEFPAPNTNWDIKSILWARTTVTRPSLGPITLRYFAENGCVVFVDGAQIDSLNSSNAQGGNLPIGLKTVLFTPAASSFELAFKCFDETSPAGGATLLVCEIPDSTYVELLDMNPAHIVRECLVNPDWGMGYADADMDDTSFTAAADTLYDEGFGLSLIWDKQMPIEDFVKEVLRHIDATLFVNRTTGTFTLKLIRDDYDEGTLLELNESNVARVDDFARRGFDELYNSVTVKYVNSGTNRDAAVEVQDIAQIQIQNAIINTTASYVGISNGTVASKVAARDLRAMSSPIASCTIYASTVTKDLTIGDVFKLTWPDYDVDTLIMRVAAISYGDGVDNTVRIQATQDVFSTPDVAYVAIPVVDWVDISAPPVPVEFQLAFEAPYYELVQQLGQASADSTLATNEEAGYVGVAAVQPGGAINAVLSTDAGAGYTEAGAFNFCPSATIVRDLTQNDVVVELANGVDLSSVSAGTHAQLGDEIVVVVSIVGTTFTFERGALDTVPAEHVAGDRMFFWDVFFGSDPTEYNTGETVNAKVQPITGLGQLDIDDAVAMSVTLAQRALRPYPPADFQIQGQYFPSYIVDSFDITWVHRDRLQQTAGVILSFLDGTIGPEAGTTYNGYVYDDDTSTLLDSTTGVSGLLWSPAVSGSYRLRAEVESERAGIVSWQRQSAVFDFIGTDGRATDDEDYRVTDNGALRILD